MQRGSAALFLLIAGLIIAGLVGVFYFNPLKSPIRILKDPVLESKLQTYTNKTLSFEFQHSKDLSVKEDTEEQFNKRGNGDFRKNFKGYVGYEAGTFIGAVAVLDKLNNYDTNPLTIWVFNNDNNLTIDQWFQNYWYYPFVWGVFDYASKSHITLDTEATISGQLAKYKIISYQPGKPKFIYLAKDNKMYLFRIIGQKGEEILSSVKFLK